MRIVLANTRHFLGGGDSTYTFHLRDLLISRGHRVAGFAMQDRRNIPDPDADLFVSPIDFRALNRSKSIRSGLRVLDRAVYSREARVKFARLVERVHPDLVHLQNIHGHLTPSIVLEASKRSIPVFWTLHDYRLLCPNSHFLNDRTGRICEACIGRSYYRAVISQCKKGSLLASLMAAMEAYTHQWLGVLGRVDRLIAPSRFLLKKLLDHGISPQRIVHVPHFLPDRYFHMPLPVQDEGYILFLGKMDPIKGVDTLVRACRMNRGVRVMLAGSAPATHNHLLRTLPPNVRYLGLKEEADVRKLLWGARALVLPSVCYENQPFSILEAFAAGKPVIASGTGGMVELVAHEDRGLVVPSHDAGALSEAMNRMIRFPRDAARMGERGRDYALKEHSARRHYERLQAVYHGSAA